LREEFRVTKKRPPHFYLVKHGEVIEREYVELTGRDPMDEEQLRLYYGEDVLAWQGKLLERLHERHCGITILEGPPGTGKTSFLRHLMATKADEFRFYFIPSSNFDVLRDSHFVGFWAGQRSEMKDKTMIVVMEDAESVLATRAWDNRSAVSNLL